MLASSLVGAAVPGLPLAWLQSELELEGLLGGLTRFDDLSQLVVGIAVLVALFALWSIVGSPGSVEYAILVLIFLVSVTLTVSFSNLILFYLFWEITALCAWGLSRWSTFSEDYSAGAFPMQGAGALGSLCMLLAVMLLVAENRSLSMSGLNTQWTQAVWLLLLTAVFLKGYGLIAQGWRHDLDKAYGVSRGLVASAGAVTLSAYPYLRFFGDNFAGQEGWRELTLWYAIPLASLVLLAGLSENDIHRIISSTAFAQFCMVMLGLALFTGQGSSGALLGMVAYALGVSALFFCTGVLESRAKRESLELLRGMAPSLPVTAFLFVFSALAFAGLPPSAGFISRLILGAEYLRADQISLLVATLAISGLTLLVNLRLFVRAFLGPPSAQVSEGNWAVLLGVLGILCLLVYLGLQPEEGLRWVQPALLVVSR